MSKIPCRHHHGEPVARQGHKPYRVKPRGERDFGVVKDRVASRPQVIPTTSTSKRWEDVHSVPPSLPYASRTHEVIAKSVSEKKRQTLVFGAELRHKLGDGQGPLWLRHAYYPEAVVVARNRRYTSAIPSRRLICGFHPSAASRAPQSSLRGVPSGWDVSHSI